MLVTRHPSVNELGERRGVGEEGLLRRTEDEREREFRNYIGKEKEGSQNVIERNFTQTQNAFVVVSLVYHLKN